VLLATRKDALSGDQLKTKLVEMRATAIQATPFTFRQLLDAGFQAPRGFKMFCGGEAWSPSMAKELLAGGGRLWNMYGPTETTVWSAVSEVKADATEILIGEPIANTRLYVLDEDQRPVTPGMAGELWIAGGGLARGYWKQPELTAQRFLQDREIRGERMYRTGDQVRQVADGRLSFLGRNDHQVKHRGFRIELGEIESAIQTIAGVKQAIALLRKENEEGESSLLAFYSSEGQLTPEQVRLHLQQLLPAYMVPQSLRALQQFPVTPNGKTDRAALLLPEWWNPPPQERVPEETSSTVSSTETMSAIWQELFPQDAITPQSDFFDLGGDSLLVLQLQAMVERRLQLTLTLADVYRASTVEALTAHVEQLKHAPLDTAATIALDSRLVPLRTGGSGPPIFLMPQILLFEQLAHELGATQPVYALELLEEDITPEFATANFESFARRYSEIIRAVQPSGPYFLGGWCMWGLVAYEVARVLEKDGEQVAYVLVMDAASPGYWNRYSLRRQLSISVVHKMHRVGWILNRLWYSNPEKRKADVTRRLRNFLLSMKERALGQHGPKTQVQKALTRAANEYRGGPLNAPVILIKGDHRPVGPFIEDDLGWSHVAGHPVDVATVEGNHSEIFDDLGAHTIAGQVHKLTGSMTPAYTVKVQGMGSFGSRLQTGRKAEATH
jgi:thioesterase domain-containing protein/acyl carrier protein